LEAGYSGLETTGSYALGSQNPYAEGGRISNPTVGAEEIWVGKYTGGGYNRGLTPSGMVDSLDSGDVGRTSKDGAGRMLDTLMETQE
jgi:hypothetical protein